MRVLIPNHFPLEGSGSGIYTQNVAREVVAKGHEALVITPGHDEQTGFPFEVRTVLFTPTDGPPDDQERLPFNFPCFTTHPASTTTFADLDAAQQDAYVGAFQAAIDAALVDWQPDIIHAQHLWVTAHTARMTSLPYVATAHGTDLMGFRKFKSWTSLALDGARNAQAIIAISRQVSRNTQDLYDIPEEQIRLVWNGFNQAIFRVQPGIQRADVLARHSLPTDPACVVSFVGKLTDFKGVDVLLDAAAIYESQLGDVLTLIVGDGELRAELEAQAERLGLKSVHFLGHQNQPDVAELYNIANVSTVPSRIEPFGLVAVEALACGTPVVATNEGGLLDFVDARLGALVNVGDAAGLSEAIVSEIKADAKTTKGPFAADYALKGFSWSGQVEKMIDIYREALVTSK